MTIALLAATVLAVQPSGPASGALKGESHKAVTRTALEYFRGQDPGLAGLTASDIDQAVQGAFDEDVPLQRAANHFFDFIHRNEQSEGRLTKGLA